MKSNTMFILVVLSLTVSFLIEPAHAVAADYQIIESGFPIAITSRHEQQPWNEYNPIDNNYMITYNTMGKLRDYCSSPDAYECNECFHSIETVTLSPGGTIQALSSISPPEGRIENCSWKSMPRVAHNPTSNEYLMIFAKNSTYICLQCHETSVPEEGATTYPSTCAGCHPLSSSGSCNLVTSHAGADSSCLDCHTECTGGDGPTGSACDIKDCMECHEGVKHNWVHGLALDSIHYVCRLDPMGNMLSEPRLLHDLPLNGSPEIHPAFEYNPTNNEYLLTFNKRGVFSKWYNNVGYILDEAGNIVSGPERWGTGDGHHFIYDAIYNPANENFMLNWEDFRHSTPPYYFWPNDVYGALVSGEGIMTADFATIEDCGEPDQGDQWWPAWVLNTDKNEWLVTWVDKRASLEESTAIMGRFIDADGNFMDEPFIIVDGHKTENQQGVVYVPDEKKYFMIWQDSRNYVIDPEASWLAENDIYGVWLDGDTALPVGDEVPIYVGPGDQTVPRLTYNPVMNQFLISWWDTHALGDFNVLPCEVPMWAGPVEEGGFIAMPMMGLLIGDIRGTIYGEPSFLTVRVVKGGSGDPVENAMVMIVGPGLLTMESTNIGGWCNLSQENQRNGTYFVIVWSGLSFAVEPVVYKGESLETTVAIR